MTAAYAPATPVITASGITRFRLEALCHTASLLFTYLVLGLLVREGTTGWIERLLLLPARNLIDVVLIMCSIKLAYVMFSLLPDRWARARIWSLRLVVSLLYVVLFAQLLFRKETGMFFSGQVALYALSNFTELSKVLAGSTSNLTSVGIVALATTSFVIPVIASGRHRAWMVATALLALPAVVLISQLGIVHREGMGRRLAAESALIALLQPSYPDMAGGQIPVYRPPVIAKVATVRGDNPNIVLVILESTRAISIPPFDSGSGPRAQMPHLMALSQRSRIFTRAYTTTSHTSKALVGILCGIHPYPEMKVVESQDSDIPSACLPRLLTAAGYRTLFIQSATEKFENRAGLVANFGFETGLYKEQIENGHASSGYFGLDEAAIPPQFAEWWRSRPGIPKFATLLTSMTHHPYQEVGKPTATGNQEQLQSYLNVLAYTDSIIQRIIKVIEDSGEAENSIIIVTGDHGESFGEHGPRQHDSVPFEEVIRVPLLVWDGRGKLMVGEDSTLRQHVDIFPTVMRLAGGHIESGPGLDLFSSHGHEQVITSCWYAGACMAKLTTGIKWIYAPSSRELMAFDLAVDPNETNDISRRYTPSQRQGIAMELLRHQESIRSFYIDNEIHP